MTTLVSRSVFSGKCINMGDFCIMSAFASRRARVTASNAVRTYALYLRCVVMLLITLTVLVEIANCSVPSVHTSENLFLHSKAHLR